MKVLKSIGLILLVLLLLVSIVSASNHTVAFWRLIKGEEISPYLYMYEDFSDLTWTEGKYLSSSYKEYISQSDVRVIPFEGSFSTEGDYLTLNVEANSGGFPSIKVPFDNLKAKENFALDNLSYFVITYDIWSNTTPPANLSMRNLVYDEYGSKPSNYDNFSLKFNEKYYGTSALSKLTFSDNPIYMSRSSSDRDKICCLLAVNSNDISKSTVSYFVNGVNNELSYSNCFTGDSYNLDLEYISHYEFSLSSAIDCSISIDNFSVYAFDRSFKGDIKDVFKEVNYK